MSPINVAVVGATGMVGETFLKLLEERKFPFNDLKLFASDRSAGSARMVKGRQIQVESLSQGCFKGIDLVFFSSGDDVSKEWAPEAEKSGAIAVDNSAAFRMHKDKLLIVPEVNGHLLPKRGTPAIIANPNCSTIQLVMALKPILQDFGLESVFVASYQAVSGAGKAGQDELQAQLTAMKPSTSVTDLGNALSPQTFPHSIAYNCIPQIGSFNSEGFCSEEMKIMQETKKILGDNSVRVSAFTVRIPAWNAHSEAVWVRLKKLVTREQFLTSLAKQSGLKIEDDPEKSVYPLASLSAGQDAVSVGRVHQDLEDDYTWLMWIVADNLRKGAALNGIQIAERIFDINPRA